MQEQSNPKFEDKTEVENFYSPASHTDTPLQPAPRATAEMAVEWQASEYIYHAKSITWLIVLGIVTAAVIAIAIWVNSWSFAVLAAVMGVTVGLYAWRQPRTMTYRLNANGLGIEGKTYPYSDFRAFGVLKEGAFFSAVLFPSKRFMPNTTFYFSESDGEKIVDVLGSHLPMENVKENLIDIALRKVRF